MVQELEQAFEKLSALPPDEQVSYAAFILAELESEIRWDALFTAAPEILDEMEREALNEKSAGNTVPLERLLEIDDE